MPLKQILLNPDTPPPRKVWIRVEWQGEGYQAWDTVPKDWIQKPSPTGLSVPRSPKPKEAEKRLLYSIFLLLFLFMRWEGPNNT